MIKHIIFDFDGTLADSKGIIYHVLDDVAKKYNKPPFTNEDLEYFLSLPVKEAIKEAHVKWYQILFYLLTVKKSINQRIEDVPFFIGIEDVLRKLNETGIVLSIISNNSLENIKYVVDKHSVTFFENIITSKGIFKKQQLLNRYIKRNKLQNDEVIYIGDEVSDIVSCKVSRVKSIAVTWGYDSMELIKSEKPDFIAYEPHDILKIVDDLALY